MKIVNDYLKLPEDFYSVVEPQSIPSSELVHLNESLINELYLNGYDLSYFDGSKLFKVAPISLAYSGHQFGQWAGKLGDGRAVLIGQIDDENGNIVDLQLKGAGKTPYSRFGDGQAVIRSCIREYLASEAMHGLDIPTTRALTIFKTGIKVQREEIEEGAVMSRVAKTHIRFGHFENLSVKNLKSLADYVIEKFSYKSYEDMFSNIVLNTAKLIANWQSVGFCHGVMNTDNMSILGETIDYGPYAFMENFDPNFICNLSDDYGRYSYNKQPEIAFWNLNILAYSLREVIDIEKSRSILLNYQTHFNQVYKSIMRKKIGFRGDEGNIDIIWLKFLGMIDDYTNSFRNYYDLIKSDIELKDQYLSLLKEHKIELDEAINNSKLVNPKYILRNWIANYIIENPQKENFDSILNVLRKPYQSHKDADWLTKQRELTRMSCSS